MRDRPFLDTLVLVYATTSDPKGRTGVAQELVIQGGCISVQVLNELVSVLRRKFRMEWPEIDRALALVRENLPHCSALTTRTHEAARKIAKRYNYQIYDALVLASALEMRCTTVYSEDMQHGQKIDGLTIVNPFAAAS